MSNAVAATTHAPVYILNPRPDQGGIRATFGCSCGDAPKKGAVSRNVMHVWYLRHARKHGIEQADMVDARYAVGHGYAAEGKTFDEWYAGHPGLDPFTGAAR